MRKRLQTLATCWCIGLIFCLQTKAQSNLEKGYQAFLNNKRNEAKTFLSQANGDPGSKAEASLLLSVLAGNDGNEKEAFARFEDFFQSAENPYPYLFSLWSTESVFGTSAKKTPAKLAFFNRLLADPKMNGTLKAMTYGAMGEHFMACNLPDKAREHFNKIGTVDAWSLVGEFENISESGFDKPFSPITKPEPDALFTNKNGAKVNWFPMKGNRPDKWVDFTYHFFAENSVLFAQSFVTSPADQEAIIRTGTSGSLKCWVNDGLVLSESEERNNDLDTYQARIRLNKGVNRILIEVGASEINRSNFMLRLTDGEANPLQGLTYSSVYQGYTKSGQNALPPRIPVFAETYFEDKIANGKGGVIDHLMLANAYLRNDKGYEARRILAAAQKLAPQCSYLRIKQIEAYNRSGNETEAKITLEWLKENDADNLLSLNLLLEEEVEKERYEAAQVIIDKIEKLYGPSEEVLIKRIALAAKEGKQDLLVRQIEGAYSLYPDNYAFVALKVDLEQTMNKSTSKAITILKKFLKTNYNNEAQKLLSDLYFGAGQASQGVEAYKSIILRSPWASNHLMNMGKYYFGTRDYAKALDYYKQCVEIAPDIYYFWSAMAQVYKEMGNDAQARTYYQKALELNPTDFEAREQLRKIQSKPLAFEYFTKTDVYDIIRKSQGSSAFPDENSLVLLDEVQKVVYAGGVSEEKRIFVVKILKPDAIDRWKQYYVEHFAMQQYDVEKAEVVKANGSKIEGNSNGDEIVFSNLEVGDAVHVTYRLKSYNTGKLAGHFWETFHFNYFMPSLTTRYSLLIDRSIAFRHRFSKENLESVKTTKDEFDLYTWQKDNQTSLPYEERMPELSDIGNSLHISSLPDWTFVSNWYNDLAASKSKTDPEVKEAVEQLFAGKTGLSEMEKARMIYAYIVGNIKYISVAFLQSGLIPQKASQVLNTRLGDCKDVSTLFVAMCKEVGIQADLVLIATRNQGKHQMLLPTIDFNHCIARLSSGGKTYFIELTSDKLPFNSFYDNLKNASSLVIYPEGNGKKSDLELLNPPTRNQNTVSRTTSLKFDNETVLVEKVNYKTGVFAANMRETFRDMGQQDQQKEMQRAIAGDFNQTILTALRFEDLQGVSDTVRYRYSFKAPDAATKIGGLQLLPLPWSEKARATDFTLADDRTFPIDLWPVESDGEEEILTVSLPAGMVLAESPKNVSLSTPMANYSLTYTQAKDKLTIVRKFRYLKDLIEVAEIKAFDSFYRAVVSADNRQLAFKPAKP